MNEIEKKMYELTVKSISQKTGIKEQTLYRWRREENIDNMVDFIHFLHTLEIDPIAYMKRKKGLE